MGTAYQKQPESSAVIRFSDCDPYGHLNNARYIDYFLNAREDQLIAFYDLDIYLHGQQTGQNWIVTKNHIAYLAPAMLHEQVRIRTRVLDATERTIIVEGLMLDDAGARPKAVWWCEFTYIGMANGRPRQHSAEMMALLNAVRDEQTHNPDGFNQRVAEIRDTYRARRRAAVNGSG